MVMPAFRETYWTAERVRALPDDANRYECIDGELMVTPSPRPVHQLVVQELHLLLGPIVRAMRPATLFLSPADVELTPGDLVQPDLFICVPKPERTHVREWPDIGALLLAVEVLSPSTARVDRGRKREYYQRIGALEYWIVDPDTRSVERWSPEAARGERRRGRMTWTPASGTGHLANGDGVEIDLDALFARALDP
jgi:Uma2 family endonuclease